MNNYYGYNKYNRYSNKPYKRYGYRRQYRGYKDREYPEPNQQPNEGRVFRGVQDLKPTSNEKTEFVRASLTVGQVELLKKVLMFIKDVKTLNATTLGVTEEAINVTHMVLTLLYGNNVNNNVPTKEQWREFYKWLAEYNK